MIRIYLKQAWELLRQNRLFSTIYIIGTGLAIALTMTMFIIFYVKLAPIYPEYNRGRMVVLKAVKCYPKGQENNYNAGLLNDEVASLLDSLPHLDAMGIICGGDMFSFVGLSGQKQVFKVHPLFVNDGFWEVFTFRFLEGKAFTREEVEARSRVAILSESTARRLFASTDVVGQRFQYKGTEYQVAGVVQDVSSVTPVPAADVWLPLSLSTYAYQREPNILRGNLQYYLTAPTSSDKGALKEEVRNAFRRHDSAGTYVNDLMGQPDDSFTSSCRTDFLSAPDMGGIIRGLLFIVVALLFIPAMNLSGMIASRMDQRTAEMGIRKTYGATRQGLVSQVLWENLLLTFLGGLAGLVFSYLIVATSSSWILTLFDAEVNTDLPAPFLTFEMLFNPWVFLSAFGVCLLLNLVSALVPAWLGMRHTIVQELYTKR